MKEIKCRKCKKLVEVEDNFNYKTCPICRVKENARRDVEKEMRRLDRESKKLIKSLKFEYKIPEFLGTYSKYVKWYQQNFKGAEKKPTFPEYQERAKEEKKRQIWFKSDEESRQLQLDRSQNREYLRPDSFAYGSDPRKCEAYRLAKLNEIEDLSIDEHLRYCNGECDQWNYYREEGYLQTREQEETAHDKPQTEEDKIEKMLDRGKDVTEEALEELSKPEHPPKEETTESTLESEEDTQRILRMSEDKLKEWQQQQETEEESSSEPQQQEPSYSQQVLDSLSKLKQKKDKTSDK